jgi:hypothetical protein
VVRTVKREMGKWSISGAQMRSMNSAEAQSCASVSE